MDGGLTLGTSPRPISPTSTPVAGRPLSTTAVVKGSLPTSPTYSKQAWPTLKKRLVPAESNLSPFIAYASPCSSAVDRWKRVARKAELELRLELDSHRADNSKNNATIHRLNRRLLPLEKALGKAKEALKHQAKLTNFLKCQLMVANERKTYLLSQNESFQKRLAGSSQTNDQKESAAKPMCAILDVVILSNIKDSLRTIDNRYLLDFAVQDKDAQKELGRQSHKCAEDYERSAVAMETSQILELQEELHQADSRAETLQAQINEIYKNVDDDPDTVDGSGTKAGSPASSKDGMGSSKNVQRQNKQNIGLSTVAKIHKMQLSKQYFEEKLKGSEQENTHLLQENDRLRKLAQEAVGRSNQFLDLAQTMKADRDLTVTRLKEAEDIIKSLEALKDFVHTYLTTKSPRLGNILPAPHFNKRRTKRQEALTSKKNTEDALQIGTAELPIINGRFHTKKAVYFQDDIVAGAQNIGESLLKKLQDTFQVLAYKVETANQTAKTVQKEGEKIRLTMLEAFQELRGQKGSKFHTADDVALGVLIAARDVKQILEELEKERAVLKASESMEDEKLMLLQSQVHELSMDKLALLESIESVKNAIRSASSGHGVIQYMKGFFDRRIVYGENISEVLEMVGNLISERNEARSIGGGVMEEKLLKEKELSDLRKLYAQSQTLTTHLQVEKDLLKRERNELKANCEDLKRQKASWDIEKKGENDKKILELKSQVQDLLLDRAALLETLEAIKNALASSKTGHGALQHLKGFLKRSVVQGMNVSEVVDMVEKWVTENDEAKQEGTRLMKERALKEKEVEEIKKFFAHSERMCVNLEEEKALLNSKLMAERAIKERELDEIQQLFAQSQGMCANLEEEKNLLQSNVVEERARNERQLDEIKELSTQSQGMRSNLEEEKHLLHSKLIEEMEIKERELDEIEELFAQSQSMCINLKEEKQLLHRKLSEEQQTAHDLKTEKESIDVSSVQMERKHLELQNQLDDLTREQAASQEILKTLKHTFTAAEEGEEGSELVTIAEKLVKERDEVRSKGREFQEELKMKEMELSGLRHSYAESRRLSEILKNDKEELEKEATKLRHTFRTIEGSISGGSDLDVETSDISPLTTDNLAAEVIVIQEKLNAANVELARDRKVFELISQQVNSTAPKEDHTANDWESEASVLISTLKGLQDEKQQLAGVVTTCTEVHYVLNKELKKLFEVMIPAGVRPTSLMENGIEIQAQDYLNAGSDFRKVVGDLPSIVEAVGKLTREQKKLEQHLHALECEKEDAVRRNNEHLEKIGRLSDSSQQEANQLREQLRKVQSFVSSVSVERSMLSGETSKKQDIQHNSVVKELEEIIKELTALRTEKAHLEVTLGELRSKGGSEQEKMHDLAMKLSVAEKQVQTLSSSALAAESRIQSSENRYEAAEAQLFELFGTILPKDVVQGLAGKSSTSEGQSAGIDIGAKIKALQQKVLEEVSKRAKEASRWKGQLEALERDFKLSAAEVEKLKEKLSGQGEFIKKHTAEWTRLVDTLKGEIARLGGADIKDEGEKLRKSIAAEKVKELVSLALTKNPSTSSSQASSSDASTSDNPLCSLATFQVDLLVNGKVHSQMKVSGHNGGLCQAALHYFFVDEKTGEITFENGTVPGSQSSNLVVDVFMQSVDSKKAYQSQAGDLLGLRIKLSAISDPSPKEVLHNTSILRTDEVLEAIQGQMIQNFSLWPDIMSSWRWERDAKKNKWSLMSVRWRFLLKNIFPDLSSPLQDLTIKGASAPRSSSIHIL